MTNEEYNLLIKKIEREFPIRLQLWELAGNSKINIKNYKAVEALDQTVSELFLLIALNKPENIASALLLIQPIQV